MEQSECFFDMLMQIDGPGRTSPWGGVSWHAGDSSRYPPVLCGESRRARLSYRRATSASVFFRRSAYGLPYAPPQDWHGGVPPAVYPNGIEEMVSAAESTGCACVRGSIARPNLAAQEIRT
jgi:hypothetical protein